MDGPDLPYILKKNVSREATFVNKIGRPNLRLINLKFKSLRFIEDLVNTLVGLQWRWLTIFVFITHMLSYILFAGMWMFDAWLSGDFTNKTSDFCIQETRHFTGYLLLSIETITSTGYGVLYPTESCYLAWVILWLSTMITIIFDGGLISVIFLKLSKPMKKDSLAIFSKKSVICLRNGRLCLLIRVYDLHRKHAIESNINITMIEFPKDKPLEAQLKELNVQPMKILFWPIEIIHEIDNESPLWDKSAEELLNSMFQIIVTISGTSMVTGQFSVSRTSYTNNKISWGYRFKPCMDFDEVKQQHKINEYNLFGLIPCDTPLCSARALNELKEHVTFKDSIATNTFFP